MTMERSRPVPRINTYVGKKGQQQRSAATTHTSAQADSLLALIASFTYAFQGLGYLFRTQRNARIHVLVGACAFALGWVLGFARWEWVVLLLTCALVIAAEGINTAIEAAVDVATSTYHPKARIAKDVAAGTVLFCAIISIIMGCMLFIPHLWAIILSFQGFRF